jgi:hypothetical protein
MFYNFRLTRRQKQREEDLLKQGLTLHTAPAISSTPLPPSLPKPSTLDTGASPEQHTFHLPDNTAGRGGKIRNRQFPVLPVLPLAPAPVIIYLTAPPAPPTTTHPVPLIQPSPGQPSSIQPSYIQPSPGQPSSVQPSSVQPVPYSTRRYWKRKLDKEQEGVFKRTYKRVKATKVCKKCGEDRSGGDHRQYYGNYYCPAGSTVSCDEWRTALKEAQEYHKRRGQNKNK